MTEYCQVSNQKLNIIRACDKAIAQNKVQHQSLMCAVHVNVLVCIHKQQYRCQGH